MSVVSIIIAGCVFVVCIGMCGAGWLSALANR